VLKNISKVGRDIISPYKSLILDMDGVLWRGDAPIGDLPAIFARLRARGLKIALATNNSTRSPEQYVERLRGFGVDGLETWQVVTSANALAYELLRRFPDKGEIYVIGEIGLRQALTEAGFTAVDEENFGHAENIVAVAAAVDRGINYAKLRRATLLIRAGKPFYGANPDRTFPTPEGFIPGSGALLAALEAATDVKPIVVGKPAPFILDLARQRLGTSKEETLVVGDRLETDIAGGQAAGMPVALVLSGVSTREQAEVWKPKIELVAEDLEELIG